MEMMLVCFYSQAELWLDCAFHHSVSDLCDKVLVMGGLQGWSFWIQKLPHVRQEPAPAIPQGTRCWPKWANELHWLHFCESKFKKGKNSCAGATPVEWAPWYVHHVGAALEELQTVGSPCRITLGKTASCGRVPMLEQEQSVSVKEWRKHYGLITAPIPCSPAAQVEEVKGRRGFLSLLVFSHWSSLFQ